MAYLKLGTVSVTLGMFLCLITAGYLEFYVLAPAPYMSNILLHLLSSFFIVVAREKSDENNNKSSWTDCRGTHKEYESMK